ncbi:MAG: hypothetical protein AB7O59_02605 [Pirellulales bacterium]
MGWAGWIFEEGAKPSLPDRAEQLALLEERLRAARNRDAAVTEELHRLTAENNELKLYVTAIFRLLLDKRLVHTDELDRVIRQIDLEDGVEDHQLRPVGPAQ